MLPFWEVALKNAFAATALRLAMYDDICGPSVVAIGAVLASSIGGSVEPSLYFLQNRDHIDELEVKI